jgi:hypothetical protein
MPYNCPCYFRSPARRAAASNLAWNIQVTLFWYSKHKVLSRANGRMDNPRESSEAGQQFVCLSVCLDLPADTFVCKAWR